MWLIDGSELKEWVENWFVKHRHYHPYSKANDIPIPELYDLLEQMPTVDAVPVRHGRWIKNDNGTWSCERCHSWIPDEQHHYARFCLYCGAKMDGAWNEIVRSDEHGTN